MPNILHEKTIVWNESKSEWLREKREIGFEEIAFRLMGDGLVDIMDHPDPRRYPGQKIFIVRFGDQF